jgi:ActR/RegA family two-component response regulator
MCITPGRILLVDDHRDLCDTIKDRFERHLGIEVDAFYDGDTALEHLSRIRPNPYRIVILDMYLPRLADQPVDIAEPPLGVHLLRAHQVLTPGTPIIVYTGHPNLDNCVECIKAGAYHYLAKIDSVTGKSTLPTLLDCCRNVLNPTPDKLDLWLREFGIALIEKFKDRYVALVPVKEARTAGVAYTELGGEALIVGSTIEDIRLLLVRNKRLRWLEPKIFHVIEPHHV